MTPPTGYAFGRSTGHGGDRQRPRRASVDAPVQWRAAVPMSGSTRRLVSAERDGYILGPLRSLANPSARPAGFVLVSDQSRMQRVGRIPGRMMEPLLLGP